MGKRAQVNEAGGAQIAGERVNAGAASNSKAMQDLSVRAERLATKRGLCIAAYVASEGLDHPVLGKIRKAIRARVAQIHKTD